MALPDYTPRNVVYHDICNPTSEALPPQIYEYVAAMNTLVLPAQSFEELARYCDDHGREELLQVQTRLKAQGRVSDGAELGGLAHILPDVASTVRHVRQHRRLGDCVDLMYTILIFVETCLSAVSPDAFVLEDVQFALSRPPHSLSDPLARFLPYYAKASFAFVPLEISVSEDDDMEVSSPELDTQHSREASPMQTSESAPSSYTSYPSDFEEWLRMPNGRHHSRRAENRSLRSYAFQEDERSEDEQQEPVELAPQTELLARRGSDKLCTLVIAPRNHLPQAMSSALYHRCACGVLGPITGLVINQDSTEVEFAVGWLGDTPASENELPTVNISWCTANACSSGNSHELTDMGSTLLIGAMILALMGKCDSEREAVDMGADPMIYEDLSWRTDSVTPPDERESRDQDAFISSWTSAQAAVSHHLPASPANTDSQQLEMPPRRTTTGSDMSTGSGKSAGGTKATDGATTTRGGKATSGGQAPSDKKATGKGKAASSSSTPASQQARVTTQSQPRSRQESKTVASSTYSKMAAQTGTDKTVQPFWAYLRDRHVISIMFPPSWLSAIIEDTDPAYHEHCTRIAPFVDCYHNYITLPRSCLEQLPPQVQAHVDPIVSRFYESLCAFQDSLANCAHEPWMDGLSELLHKHCHVIMRISVLSERAKRIVKKVDDIEIRFRKYIDLLLEIGLDNLEPEDGGVVVATLYEKQLQMPSNKLYHQANQIADLLEDFDYTEKAVAALYYPILHQRTILRQEHQAYRDALHNLDPVVPQIEAGRMEQFAASARLWQFKQEQLSSDVRSDAIRLDLLAQPSAQAPRTGKCDAVGVLRIPGVFPVLTEEARAFQILRPPSSTTVDPNGGESQPADGVTETQQLDIRKIGLERTVDPTVSHDIFASARSGRLCNILGQTSSLGLTPVITTAREMEPIPEHPAPPTSPSSESNQQPEARLGVSPAAPPAPTADIRAVARVNQVLDSSRPAVGSVPGPADITNDDVKDDLRDPRVEPLPEKEEFDLHTDSRDLYVPLIVVENKKVLSKYDVTGANQLRGYLAALSTYLEHLGVYNFPQFGILTEGTVAVVTCAWSDILKHPAEPARPRAATRSFASSTHRIPNQSTVTYIMERNACSFDISDPRDALNLVAFLYKISRIHAPKLKEALRETCDKIRMGEFTSFTKWNQNQFYPAPKVA